MNISSYRVLKWISVITLCMFRKQKMGNELIGWLRIIFSFLMKTCAQYNKLHLFIRSLH